MRGGGAAGIPSSQRNSIGGKNSNPATKHPTVFRHGFYIIFQLKYFSNSNFVELHKCSEKSRNKEISRIFLYACKDNNINISKCYFW
jgi:hypothetical protein